VSSNNINHAFVIPSSISALQGLLFNVPLFFAWFVHQYGDRNFNKNAPCSKKHCAFKIFGHLMGLGFVACAVTDITFYYKYARMQ
jgi:hypothetical protein